MASDIEQRRLRLGLLGAGRRAQLHLSTIAGLAKIYQFVAVCDLSQEKADRVADRFNVKAYSDIKPFFARERLDVVDIVTPAECHHLMAKVAAEHGVNMLIETPLAPTRAMMDVIGEAADRAGVVVEVGESRSRRPPERLNRKALDAGLIGKPLRVSIFYETGGYHGMSLLRRYAGAEVEEVRGFARQFEAGDAEAGRGGPGITVDTETWTQALLFFANGVLGSYTRVSSCGSALREGHPCFISVEGGKGLIASDRGGNNALHRVEDGRQAIYPLKIETRYGGDKKIPVRFYYETNPQIEYVNPFADLPIEYHDDPRRLDDDIARADELTSIYRAVVRNESAEYGIANARRDQELCIAIVESARLNGLPVRLPLADETQWEREQHQAFRSMWGGDPLTDADKLIARDFLRVGHRRQRDYDYAV
jgi:predicted dehydrogenase